MASRKPAAAPRRRALARRPGRPKHQSRLTAAAAAERAGRLPHHPRYTPALLAQVRQRFEDTPEPIPSMAADLGVAPQSLHRIARRHGWVRRNPVPPPRDVPPALRILEEAKALEAREGVATADCVVVVPGGAASPPPPERGRSPSEARRVGVADLPNVTPTRTASQSDLPLSGGGSPATPVVAVAEAVPAAPALASTIERLERAVLAELATIEAMRAALGTLPQKPAGAARTVRTLSMLTQTLQHLQRLRASAALTARPVAGEEQDDDDDMPADIDEFRRELARRIEAFVASRTDERDAGGDAAAAAVDEAQS